ncbi:MAG TPA: ATP-binding protein [Streptosporangiaceae bacterium]
MHAHRSGPDKSDRAYRWLRLFRGQESELGQLRHWLTGLLPDSPGRDDLISVAVELGTNAVQHTASGNGGWFTVEVATLGPMLRVSVTDEGSERGPSLSDDPPADPDLDDVLDAIAGTRCDRGRGLLIVRALAVTCGVCGNASGRTVWAEVARAPAQTEIPAQAEIPTQAWARIPAHTPARIHTRTPSLSLPGPLGTPRPTNGQGRSSRPAASSAMAISRTL